MIAFGMLSLVESRVDRFLVTLGVVFSVSAGFLLMNQSQDSEFLSQSPMIGTIKTSSEISRRHSRSLSWRKIEKESKLYLKDMIYVPPKSSAEVFLNSNEKLTLEPDSMVEFDSISSDRFNIVLMQGAAKLVSSKGVPTAVLTQKTEMEVRMPEVEKPQLPMFFIDTKSWERSQEELIQGAKDQQKTIKLLSETEVKINDFNLNSLLDYKLELTPPQVTDSSSPEGPWYKFSWVAIPLDGTTYEIEFSRNKDFKPAIRHETQQASLEIQFLEGGTHFWKVIAKKQNERSLSASETFSVPAFKEDSPPDDSEEEE